MARKNHGKKALIANIWFFFFFSDIYFVFKSIVAGCLYRLSTLPFPQQNSLSPTEARLYLYMSLCRTCSQCRELLPFSQVTAFHDFTSRARCLQITQLDESRLCKDIEPAACNFYLYTRHHFDFIAPICFLSLITGLPAKLTESVKTHSSLVLFWKAL